MQTSKQPVVSVVIPTYNRAELVLRAINSVLGQTYQNLEIVVVDDYSQDNTEEVVTAIKDKRINYHRHDSNQGGSAARNTGIEQARGQYIAFLDSDDVWLSQKLELQLAIATQTQNPVVSYTKFQKSDRVFYQPSILPKRGKKPTESVADYLWLRGGEVLTSTLLVSCSLAKYHLFQTGLPKHQDLDFVLRLGYSNAEFIFIPQVLTIWHNEPRSDRVSGISSEGLSLNWIKLHRDKISNSAYKGFVLKEVVPKMLSNQDTKSTAIKLLIEGLYQRIIPLHYFLFLIIKQVASKKSQQFVKNLLQKIKILN